MKNKELLKQHVKPVIIAILVLLVLIFAAYLFTQFKMGLWEKDIRTGLQDFMSVKKSSLEKALYSRIYYTRGVSAYVALNPDITDNEFAALAKEYIRNDSVINTMALSKDCIISAIYPLEGHEEALGLNLLGHPERKTIVEKTIETHLTFVAGPVQLVEGGIAFISYTPIFDKLNGEKEQFWGVADIVIKQNSLFHEAGLKEHDNKYEFAIRGVNGMGNSGEVFWGDKKVFEDNPVTITIDLPIGNWVLAAIPQKGWQNYADQDRTLFLILFLSAVVISILVWLFSRALLKIRYNEKELKAIFATLDSLIIEFDVDGTYLNVATTNSDLLYLPQEELIGKKLQHIFDKEKADYFLQAINECIRRKELVVIEYPIQIKDNERWFSARISYKSESSIIFNAYEITEAKSKEKLLRTSEQQLKELNETKDKFFSIIAHDLRSPLGNQKGVIDLIVEEYEDLDEVTRKNLLNTLQDSSNHLYELLESLLEWAMSQTGKIKIECQEFNLKIKYASLLSQLEMNAKHKNIQLINELEEDAIVWGDVNLTESVLRNLISNAIKFTSSEGEIRIHTTKQHKNNKSFLEVSVSDNGMGMEVSVMDSLFKLDKSQSLRGTANERGNGLGLLLCKEFVEMQGGEIKVVSTKGEGSTFSFSLPLP